jgi:hypothetical protein
LGFCLEDGVTENFLLFVSSLILAACAYAIFMLVRNKFVYSARTAILDIQPIHEALRLHDALPDYDEMLHSPRYWFLWTPNHWMAWVARRSA